MKALVTGATGFVGRHLVYALGSAGIEVRGLSSRDVDLASDPRIAAAELERIIETERPDVVVHLAGPKPYADPGLMERLCVKGTEALIRALRSHRDAVGLVAAGSSAEYGYSTAPDFRLNENHEPHPSTPYGAAKLRQSLAVLEAGGTVLRLFNCIGPGQGDDLVAGRIVYQLAEGADRLVLKETASKRDFLDVRDAASAFVQAITSLPQGIYNVCSGVATGIDELIEKAFEASGIPPIPVEIEMSEFEGSHQCGDPSRLESFGWIRRYEIVDSLRDALFEARRTLSGSRRPTKA